MLFKSTAEKLILEKKKKLSNRKKKQLSIMQETYVYCDIRYETLSNTNYVERLQSLKPVDGTLIIYLLDGNTFIIRIQRCVLEVP